MKLICSRHLKMLTRDDETLCWYQLQVDGHQWVAPNFPALGRRFRVIELAIIREVLFHFKEFYGILPSQNDSDLSIKLFKNGNAKLFARHRPFTRQIAWNACVFKKILYWFYSLKVNDLTVVYERLSCDPINFW